MDFMAPRALSPSFNKVKSKDLSIRQWGEHWMQQFLIPEIPASSACLPVTLTEEARRRAPARGRFSC